MRLLYEQRESTLGCKYFYIDLHERTLRRYFSERVHALIGKIVFQALTDKVGVSFLLQLGWYHGKSLVPDLSSGARGLFFLNLGQLNRLF